MPDNPQTEKGGRIQISLIDQKMKAMVQIMAPGNEQEPPVTLQDILYALDKAGVKYGINEAIINKYIEEKKWGDLFVAAEGTEPAIGEDARIEYHFLTVKSLKPHITENGLIDYKEVDVIGSVGKDDILLKKIPATIGSTGKNIQGDELPGKCGKDINIIPGPGTYKDPSDGSVIKAAADGVISYNPKTNTVEVQKLYVIQGSVDFSTGNVHVKSSIEIKADVNPGFSIATPYDISVKGMVERATISCDGTLTVKEGIVGDGQQLIKVGGDIHSCYIRNQRIRCGGSVYACTEIISSIIECEDEVILVKMDGIIVGGKITASSRITAGNIGNKYDVPTELEVGVNFSYREKFLHKLELISDAKNQLDEIKKKLDVINSMPPDIGPNARFKNLKEQLQAAFEKLERMNNDLIEIEKDYYSIVDPIILVNRTIFAGVIIKIKHAVFEVKEKLTHVAFRLNGNQIEYTDLK